MQHARNSNQMMAGGFLMAVALLGLYLAWPLGTGGELGLGPGYLPRMHGFLLLAVGAIMVGHGFLQNGEAPERWHLRPLLLVLAAIGFFAFAIQRFGLVIALTGLVLIACTANREVRLLESLALAAAAVVFSLLVFVKGLGLGLPVWPPML